MSSNSIYDGDSGNEIFSQTSFSDSEKDTSHRIIRKKTVTTETTRITKKKTTITQSRNNRSLSESDATPPKKFYTKPLRLRRKNPETKKPKPKTSRQEKKLDSKPKPSRYETNTDFTKKKNDVTDTDSDDELVQINKRSWRSMATNSRPTKKPRIVLPDSSSTEVEEESISEDS